MSDLNALKALASSYFEALSAGDEAALDRILHDDLSYWVVGTLPGLSGTHKKPALMAMIAPFMQLWDGPLRFEIIGAVAEGDTVVIEARNHGKRHDGRIYQNAYNIIFRARDGQLIEIREYFDTMHAMEVMIS